MEKIFILFVIRINILSYHIQHVNISKIPKSGPNQNIKIFRGWNLLASLVKSFIASEIGWSNPIMKTLLGPFR